MTDNRVTQEALQVLHSGPTPDIRVTQEALQVLHSTAAAASTAVARATQSPLLVLTEGDATVRATQTPLLVLYGVDPDLRVTQAPLLILAEFDADIRASQTPLLVLADVVDCFTKWTQTWTITRTDGQVFAFTALDRNLTFRGVVHKACNSLSPTATEMSSSLDATGSMELTGIIADADIKDSDLYNGLFDGATVEVWAVPWENTGGEIPFRLLAGTMGGVQQGAVAFTAEIITPGATIQQKPILDIYAPGCRYKLGDARCAFDLDTLEVSGGVTGVVVPTSPNSAKRRSFADTGRAEAARYFEYGEVTWTSGANTGITAEVKDFSAGVFTLWKPLPEVIAAGDAYTAKPGCDKTSSTCTTKFSNFVNFGGFPDVPGTDRLLFSPDSKSS